MGQAWNFKRQTGFSKSRRKFFGVGVASGIGIDCMSYLDRIVNFITKVQ